MCRHLFPHSSEDGRRGVSGIESECHRAHAHPCAYMLTALPDESAGVELLAHRSWAPSGFVEMRRHIPGQFHQFAVPRQHKAVAIMLSALAITGAWLGPWVRFPTFCGCGWFHIVI